ncbi:MAG: cobalt-precorrin-5B (C(1))-methyltransferase CbiD [Deltaproteobacteria bacterium]|nr:cobalt-precorrin-5B (C(1))-methyltransferase CbiD [Deltaproteobacteria bacterium]
MSALREGYTTGSCAAAAAKAAVMLLAEGRSAESVEIPLPDGRRRRLPIEYIRRTEVGAEAAVRKDAGDDPDVTNGALIEAGVAWTGGADVEFAAGDGVGTVTKPGLAVPPGEPAVNPVPRRMIREAVREVTPRGVRVTISIDGGGALAAKTFNPRLGIAGGLSILGTTGIVRPFSCSALRESLRCALSVAAAAGVRAPVFVPGHIGERAAGAQFRVAPEQIVEVGNEWGFTLDEAARHPFAALLALGHPGKLAKLTAGGWDTHSGRSESALPAVAQMHAAVLGRPAAGVPTVEGIFAALDTEEKRTLGDPLAAAVQAAIRTRTDGRFAAAVVLIDLGGHILGKAGDLTPWA